MDNGQKLPVEAPELGYGKRTSKGHQRLVNPDGSFNVRRRGDRKLTVADLYHILISTGWLKFFGVLAGAFVFVNFLFAGIYYLIGPEHLSGMITGTETDKFWESFFFSSQPQIPEKS